VASNMSMPNVNLDGFGFRFQRSGAFSAARLVIWQRPGHCSSCWLNVLCTFRFQWRKVLLELPDLEEIRKASVAPSSTQMYTRLASEIAIFIRKSTFDGDAHWQARLLELVGLRLLFSVPLSTLINKMSA
jgi:hypothetical protein